MWAKWQLVAQLIIENDLGSYKKLSQLLSKARVQELIPWEAIEDRSRSVLASAGFADMPQ